MIQAKLPKPAAVQIHSLTAEEVNTNRQVSKFTDNRPELIQSKKLRALSENSLVVQRLNKLQDMANNSPQSKRTSQLKRMMASHSSARLENQPIQKTTIPIPEKESAANTPDVVQMNPSGILALGTTGAIAGAMLVGGPIAILVGLTVGGIAGHLLTGSSSDKKAPTEPIANTSEASKELAREDLPAKAHADAENKADADLDRTIAEVKTLTEGKGSLFQNVKSLINHCNNQLIETKITYETTPLFTATPLPLPKNNDYNFSHVKQIRNFFKREWNQLQAYNQDDQDLSDQIDALEPKLSSPTQDVNAIKKELFALTAQLKDKFGYYQGLLKQVQFHADDLRAIDRLINPKEKVKTKGNPVAPGGVAVAPPANAFAILPNSFLTTDHGGMYNFIASHTHKENPRAITQGAAVISSTPNNQPTIKSLNGQQLGIPNTDPKHNNNFIIYHVSHGSASVNARSVTVFWIVNENYVKIVGVGEHKNRDSYDMSWIDTVAAPVIRNNNFKPFE